MQWTERPLSPRKTTATISQVLYILEVGMLDIWIYLPLATAALRLAAALITNNEVLFSPLKKNPSLHVMNS
jgi:hypothetical protein